MRPDNLSWTDDSQLLVTGQTQSWKPIFDCYASSAEISRTPFKLVKLDPRRMSSTIVINEADAAPSAEGTTALQVEDEIWVGSFCHTWIVRYANR